MKRFVASMLLVLFIVVPATSQDETKRIESDSAKFMRINGIVPGAKGFAGSKFPEALYYNIPYYGGLLGSPYIPISFSRVIWNITDKNISLEPNLSIGGGYTFFFGDFSFTEDGKIKINPYFLFGPAFNIGFSQETTIKLNLVLGAFIGFTNISFYGGYDFIENNPVFGLGARFDFFTIDTSSFHVFGKEVISVYVPPVDAKPITSYIYKLK